MASKDVPGGGVALDVTALQIETGSDSGSASSGDAPFKRGATFAEKGMTITLKVLAECIQQPSALRGGFCFMSPNKAPQPAVVGFDVTRVRHAGPDVLGGFQHGEGEDNPTAFWGHRILSAKQDGCIGGLQV